jgi:demethylmenaquinone methyltransferase / 2-methoxy-6-polyprenyl-1,4-benzoquinol methylase
MIENQSLFIRRIFTEVPATYERINHILTFGLDKVWRRRAARVAAAAGGSQWADLCTGTGETALRLTRLAPSGTTIYAVDFSLPMLKQASATPKAAQVAFVLSDVECLPFPDNSLDLITMSFATRNINVSRPILVRRLAEFNRVLKRGGRFVNLETSQPDWRPVRILRDLYVRLFVESVGGRISRSTTAYGYLAKSIPSFYTAEELADIVREAGFEDVRFQRLLFGVTAIHQGVKR